MRHPLLWVCVVIGTFVAIFNQMVRMPFTEGSPEPVLIYTYAVPYKRESSEFLRLTGDRKVYIQQEFAHEITGGTAFKAMLLASVLSLYPSSLKERAYNLPAISPEILVTVRAGIYTRNFRLRGYGRLSELEGAGAYKQLNRIARALVQSPGVESGPGSASKSKSS